ncbi:putative protein (DUF411 domain) [Campylobacter iguaniorum]|uniref:DUF411 domain protein n=1 Tax=Campylobacter iguaniorum TaxID=1244531 RepID=A0A076F7K5_9BACT|nr:DUF411 domain-containing protein [Campylobacter iguaniorum]AII14036.1 hypothetical protein (DUF411 domain) [Campylobacter iguaniorum]ALV23775.1 putative protein (DUF411 domain) [Campylobacter iguaniorum]
MKIISLLSAAAIFSTMAFASNIEVYKSPECGCCGNWSKVMKSEGFNVVEYKTNEIMDVKRGAKVPGELSSCHTGLIDGYVIEGHVPADEVKRLLSQKPKDIIGISTPAMPLGSPGMEQDGIEDTYDVIAFYKDGSQKVWATYKGAKKIK